MLAHVAATETEVFKGILVAHSDRIAGACSAAREEIPPSLGNVMGPFEHWVEVIRPEVGGRPHSLLGSFTLLLKNDKCT